jgi:diguanylate cyclase (GGDEF)-like protein/PAS domain S-box-containing protein
VLKKNSLINTTISCLSTPNFQDTFLVHIKKVLGSDNEQSCELELLRDDGTSFFVNIISIKEHREDEILLIRSVVFNITERKIADEKIIQISSLLKNVINTSQDLIFVKDKQLRTILCNDFFAQALGKTPEELYGRTDIENGWPEEFVRGNPDEGIHGFEADDREALSGKTVKIEYEPVNIKNEIRFFNTIKSPLTDETGNIIGVLGIARDVTDRKNMEDELKHMATHDPLTGLYNRRMFIQRINDEIERASRYQHTLSLFMIDIDYFKSINDNYGHQTGDTVLQNFAKILSDSIRKSDYAARYGGEEFVVVLPETPLLKAEELAERLRKQIEDTHFSINNNEDINLTVSIGISTFPEHAETSHELLEIADAAMYAAKAAGRNYVKIP